MRTPPINRVVRQWQRSKPNMGLTCGGETSGSMMNGIGPSPEANALTVLGERKFNLIGKRTYMMNTRTATLQITLNPLFSPKPIKQCPTTAVSAEAVRSFFLPTRYKSRGL